MEKVAPAHVSKEEAHAARRSLLESDALRLLEAVAESAASKEAPIRWRGSSPETWQDAVTVLAFASEVLRVFRQEPDQRETRT